MALEVVKERVVEKRIDGARMLEVVEQQCRFLNDGTPLACDRVVRTSGDTRGSVILVHGLAQNRFTWDLSQRSFVAALAEQGWVVYNLELRGHGRSRQYGSTNAEAFVDYVSDLSALVDLLDEPPFVIGHSLGGGVALALSTQRPLAGIVHLAGLFGFARNNAVIRALCHLTISAQPLLEAVPTRLSTALLGRAISRLYAITDLVGYGAPISGWVPDSMEEAVLKERLSLGFDWTSLAIWSEMARWAVFDNFEFEEAWTTVDLPVLVLAGDQDPLVPPQDAQHTFERCGSEDKELVCFDAFSHQVHWGHIDLIVGKHAPAHTWPVITGWLWSRSR